MTDNHDIEKNYPVRPDYGDLAFDRVDKAKNTPSAENKQASSGGYDVTVLAIVAAVLLVLITFCLIIVSRGMLVSHDGTFSLIFGSEGEDPFKRVEQSSLQIQEDPLDIDLSDPPAFSVAPVENPGVLSEAEIVEQVNPSVVAVLVSGLNDQTIVSGVILTTDGFIVTSADALRWVDSVSVVTPDGEKYAARLIGMDLSADIAVIKIDATGLDAAVFGNSNAVQVGERLVAIGTPYDLSLMGSTTSGIASAINRNIINGDSVISLIQCDITVTDGFAGGPMINKYGQVVGIITRSMGEGYSEFGFAVPLNTAKDIIEKIVRTAAGEKTEPVLSLGINAYFIEKRVASAYGFPTGLVITKVIEDTGAYAGGLREGDVITSLDGVRLTDIMVYENIKNRHNVGDMVEVTVYRDDNRFDEVSGKYLTFSVYFIDSAELQK
ncbi:MAG: trypsin-like peptidase domain-containing protein [Clostridia bacterium]|nr:trypsin-like peptidase domain-containing protein [Clostridia bacterium]